MCQRLFGLRTAPGETLLEFQKRARDAGVVETEFDSLIDYYYGRQYRANPKDASREAGFRQAVRQFESRSRRKDSRWLSVNLF